MHPTSKRPLSPWSVDDLPQAPSGSSGPSPTKSARFDSVGKGKGKGTLELERPALVPPGSSTDLSTGMATGAAIVDSIADPAGDPAGDAARDASGDMAGDWTLLSDLLGRPDTNGPENDRISPAGQAWQLGRIAQDTLSARLPSSTAAWTRRLEFAGFPDAQDWRWLPAYRQHCPNLAEIVLPKDSDAVVPTLKDHALREADGRWVLRTHGRADGVGAFQRLCEVLGRPLHDLVERPGVLGSHGRPMLLDQLARDVATLRGRAPAGPALAARVEQLLGSVVRDHQIALRCALIAQGTRSAGDRLSAMEAVAAELGRAPFVIPRSTWPSRMQDEAARMIDGLSRATDCGVAGMYATETLFCPRRARWLDRAEAAAMSACLGALPDAATTPVLRALRDTALQVLRPDPAFEDLVFLSREDEDAVRDALHLVRLFGVRLMRRTPGGLVLEAMPDKAKRALMGLRQWAGEAPPQEALRRERWYVHLAGQAHHGPDARVPTAGLLRGDAWQADLDAPPVDLIADIARSRGEALGLGLDYRGEVVADPREVNQVLAARFAFGLQVRSRHLDADRVPEALRWPDAEWLAIDLAGEDWRRDAAWRRRVAHELVRDFPGLAQLSFGGEAFPDRRDPDSTDAGDVLRARHRAVESACRLLPGLIWNGRLRNAVKAHPRFLSWLWDFLQLYRQSTANRGGGALPPLVGPVALRVLGDPAFAWRCEAFIRGQDGHCADAYLRMLHKMALLEEVGEASDAATAARVALQFACGLRADQWVIETHGHINDPLEEAMLLRQAVRARLAQRLGLAPAEGFELPIYAHLGLSGDRWRDDEETRRRDRQADALIDAEVESGFLTSHDCLVPDGLVGDFLSAVLDRETGHREQEDRLLSEATARFDAAIEAAGDDAEAFRVANEAAAQAQIDRDATLATRRRDRVLPHLAALAARLSERRADEASPVPTTDALLSAT
jgi:hypothetical protein